MKDIKEIPIEELLHDLVEAIIDGVAAQFALDNGIETDPSGDSVKERKRVNDETAKVILEELTRRDKERLDLAYRLKH